MTPAVLTSGGDAPGMNAVVAGVAEAAPGALGVRRGYEGLSEGRLAPLDPEEVRRWCGTAGTFLGSSRYPALRDGLARCAAVLDGTDGLVVVGGDGSLRGARALAEAGVRVAFVPATIDNDIEGTARTVGHDSAVAYGVAVIEQLRLTARAVPGRAFLLETLGGPTGHLARAVAAAAGVDAVLTPEEFDLAAVAALLAAREEAIAVLGEGAGNAVEVGARLAELLGRRVRPTILGHAQRAAPVTELDRTLGLAAGRLAAGALLAGRSGYVALLADGTPELRAL
jgi:6-phosphofructokinase 1